MRMVAAALAVVGMCVLIQQAGSCSGGSHVHSEFGSHCMPASRPRRQDCTQAHTCSFMIYNEYMLCISRRFNALHVQTVTHALSALWQAGACCSSHETKHLL